MWRPVRDGMLIVQFVNVVGFWLLNVLMWTRSDHRSGCVGLQPGPGDVELEVAVRVRAPSRGR